MKPELQNDISIPAKTVGAPAGVRSPALRMRLARRAPNH